MIKFKRFPALVTAALLMVGVALASPAAAHIAGEPAAVETGATGGDTPAAAQPDAAGPRDITTNAAHLLKNYNSNRCLEVEFAGVADFNRVTQFGCHQGNNQYWTMNYLGGDAWEFRNLHSDKCLEVGFNGTEDFSGVNQYRCYYGPTQQWVLDDVEPGVYMLRNVNSNKCLEVGFHGTSDFNGVNQFTCHGGLNQRWILL